MSKSVEKKFSRSAAVYHQQAEVQMSVASDVANLIPKNIPTKSVLDIGCGTGFLTARLLELFPTAQIDALDISKDMIDSARGEIGTNVSFIHSDFMDYKVSKKYDLICSSSSLQWIYPLKNCIEKICTMLSKSGMFVGALMLENSLSEIRKAREVVLGQNEGPVMLPSYDLLFECLSSEGLEIKQIAREQKQCFYSDGSAMIRAVSDLGLSGRNNGNKSFPLVRGNLKKLAELCEESFMTTKGVSCSYDIGYFITCKKS